MNDLADLLQKINTLEQQLGQIKTALSLPSSMTVDESGVLAASQGILLPQSNATALFAIDTSATGHEIVIANNGTANPFSAANNFSGLILIWQETTGSQGLFLGGGVTTLLIGESVAGNYSAAKGTANRTNVTYQASIVEIENKTGGSRTYRVAVWRTRSAG